MTQTEKSSRKVISGVGWSNPLTHDYRVDQAAHVHIFSVVGDAYTELVQGVDYTVTNIGLDAGYAVTITNAGAWAPDEWVLDARPEIDQASNLSVGGQFGTAFEAAIDKLTRRVQRIYDLSRRSLKTSISVAVGDNPYTLPAPVADKLLGWNAAGDDLENFDPTGIGIALVDDDATLGSNSSTRVPSQRAAKAYVDALKTYTDAGLALKLAKASNLSDLASVPAARGNLVVGTHVATRTALKALDTTKDTVAILTEANRQGRFIWTLGNFSTQVAADTAEGIYVKADAVASNVGAWVRSYSGPVNVLWFGADPLYVNDSAPAIKCARDLLQTNSDYRGGVIYVPAGRYKVNSTIAFTSYNQLHNIYIRGDGPIDTTLDFSGGGANTDGITFDPGVHFGVKDLMVTGAKRDNISLNPDAVVGASGSHEFAFENLRLQQAGGSGIRLVNAFMGSLKGIWAASNGVNGFRFSGFHTSLNVSNCWASGNAAGAGWNLNGICYSTFDACGADFNQYGWAISNVAGVVLNGCGWESNARDGVLLQSNDASATGIPASVQNIQGLLFDGCLSLSNGQTPATYGAHISAITANGRPISFKMRGNKTRVYTAGDPALVLNGSAGTVTYTVDDFDSDGVVVTAGTVVRKDMVNTADAQTLAGKTLASPAVTGLLDASAANAGQIKFPAAQNASADPNTLDDYEEGTFVPTIAGTTSAGAGTYSVQSGKYTKVGRQVHFQAHLVWSAHTGTGGMKISGLPFTVSGNWPCAIYYADLTYTSQPMALAANGGTDITLAVAASGAAIGVLPIDTAATMILAGTYSI